MIFVLKKATCLVTLFDRKLGFGIGRQLPVALPPQNIMFGYKYKTKTKDYLTYGVLLLFDGLFEHGLHNWVFISLTFVRRLKRCLMP